MSSTPAITVLMPVYNGRQFLPESVQSILSQTFRDFEFLIIDDGSTDGSLEFLRGQNDTRIRIVHEATNRGIVHTLNSGLELASGYYVARMDADDIALPGRLAAQYRFMEENPDVGVCGTAFQMFGEQHSPGWARYPKHPDLVVALLFENPLCHPSVMIRQAVLRQTGLRYPGDYPHAEEYAFWVRLARHTGLANLTEPLLQYRSHPQQVSRQKSQEQCRSISRIIAEQLAALGLTASPGELALHNLLGMAFNPVPGYRRKLDSWAGRILEANARSAFLPHEQLACQLHDRTAAAIERTQSQLARMTRLRRFHWRLSAGMRHYLPAG